MKNKLTEYLKRRCCAIMDSFDSLNDKDKKQIVENVTAGVSSTGGIQAHAGLGMGSSKKQVKKIHLTDGGFSLPVDKKSGEDKHHSVSFKSNEDAKKFASSLHGLTSTVEVRDTSVYFYIVGPSMSEISGYVKKHNGTMNESAY